MNEIEKKNRYDAYHCPSPYCLMYAPHASSSYFSLRENIIVFLLHLVHFLPQFALPRIEPPRDNVAFFSRIVSRRES